MSRKTVLLMGVLALVALWGVGCASAPAPTTAPATRVSVASNSASSAPTGGNSNGADFETESNEGGSVTVAVKPTALAVGAPVEFDIAMNTHAVDLSDDLTKTAFLRDDTGKEYQPIGSDGPAEGGHHRSGVLKFPALTGKPKYVELVIKGLAQVPERVFRWNLP